MDESGEVGWRGASDQTGLEDRCSWVMSYGYTYGC